MNPLTKLLNSTMKSIHDIYEGILADVEDTLANADDDLLKVMDIDKLPTVKDFVKERNGECYMVTWSCPNVLNKYRNKYHDLIPDDANAIRIILDRSIKRVTDLNMFFIDERHTFPQLRYIQGWNDGIVGCGLPMQKKMAIAILNKLARNTEKMDTVMAYADKVRKHYKELNSIPLGDSYRYMPMKSLLHL